MTRNADLINHYLSKKLIPFAGLAVMDSLFYIVDAVCAGTFLGSEALSVIQTAYPVVVLQQLIATFLGVGCCGAAVFLLGKHERKTADSIFTLAWVSIAVTSVLLSVAGLLWSKPITMMLTSNHQALCSMVYPYTSVILIFSPVLICAAAVPSFLQYDNYARLSFFFLLAANVLNYALNTYLLNVRNMGVEGLALSTVICSALSIPSFLIYLSCKGRIFHFTALKNLRLSMYAYFLKFSLNNSTTRLSSLISVLFINGLLLKYAGSTAVSAFSVFSNVMYVSMDLLICGTSIAMTCSGMLYAEKDWHSLHFVIRKTIRTSAVLLACGAAFLLFFNHALIRLFGAEDIAGAVRPCLIGLAACLPFGLINLMYSNYAQSLGIQKIALVSSISRSLVARMICYYGAIRLMGINGIWAGKFLADAVTFGIVLWYRRHLERRGKIRYPGILMIPPSEDYADDSMNLSIPAKEEDAMNVSRLATMFCMEHDLSPRYRLILGLVTEELLMNIVKHGFHDRQKRVAVIDYFLSISEDSIILRIRDDGVFFNPNTYIAEDPASGIGIRLIKGLAPTYAYSRLLGFNNSVITLPRKELADKDLSGSEDMEIRRFERMLKNCGEGPFLYSDSFTDKALESGFSPDEIRRILGLVGPLPDRENEHPPKYYFIRYHYRTIKRRRHKPVLPAAAAIPFSDGEKNVLSDDMFGGVINQIRSKPHYTPLNAVSPVFLYLLLRLEDPIFFKHRGISAANLLWAFATAFRHKMFVWGGSTITQQLAKTLFFDVSQRTFLRKLKELPKVHQLEHHFTKEEILELYINCIEYGNGNYSIYEAAQDYFHKTPDQMAFGEALMLNSIIAAPKRFNPVFSMEKARERQIRSAGLLYGNYLIGENDYRQLVQTGEFQSQTQQHWYQAIFRERLEQAKQEHQMLNCAPLFLTEHPAGWQSREE